MLGNADRGILMEEELDSRVQENPDSRAAVAASEGTLDRVEHRKEDRRAAHRMLGEHMRVAEEEEVAEADTDSDRIDRTGHREEQKTGQADRSLH